jgi:hypothetical protein
LDALEYKDRLRNKAVLVIGSETPWVEALCVAAGESNFTTLEYGAIVSRHPQITTYTRNAFRDAFLANRLESFHVVASHSSFEESRLGRYGDVLNPCGDIMSVARG